MMRELERGILVDRLTVAKIAYNRLVGAFERGAATIEEVRRASAVVGQYEDVLLDFDRMYENQRESI